MNCEILRTLYVKANGQILCNDDAGEQIVLGMPSYAQDDTGIHDILGNESYGHIRTSFASNTVPWPGICNHCALLRENEPYGSDLLQSRVVEKLQFEPSLACGLRCPSCSNLSQLRARAAPVHFPVEWMKRLLSDLGRQGYRVQTIEFCGQGEPLNHPRFADLLSVVREECPAARLKLITNGNHDFGAKIGGHFLEETIVSIDGAKQESYEKYRVHGRIEKALAFLRDSARKQMPRGGSVIWKYILFNTNDTSEEIVEAQRMAAAIDISRIWFVHGHGIMRSDRFGFEDALSIPVRYPKVKIEFHPSYNRASRSYNAVGAADLVSGPPALVWIDTLVVHPNRTLTIVGWANGERAGDAELFLRIGKSPAVKLPMDIPRSDVRTVHPRFTRDLCGFDALVSDPRQQSGDRLELEFELVGLATRRRSLLKRSLTLT